MKKLIAISHVIAMLAAANFALAAGTGGSSKSGDDPCLQGEITKLVQLSTNRHVMLVGFWLKPSGKVAVQIFVDDRTVYMKYAKASGKWVEADGGDVNTGLPATVAFANASDQQKGLARWVFLGKLVRPSDVTTTKSTYASLDQPGTRAGQEATGPDGGLYVWVPPGEFDMGAEDIGAAEKPVHHVRITKGFWLGKCTVTNAQYQRYCDKTGVMFPGESCLGDSYPVAWVNWAEAKAYCKHYGLDLPTEAQWEYAARGPEGRKWPWGNQWDEAKCCNRGNQGPKRLTFPVGSFPEGASWCGALDMAGNVWQWCKDWCDAKYYASSPETDPPGAASGRLRGLRGGSWLNDATLCRSSHRHIIPSSRNFNYGFRASRTP